jgi:hypothetical protein
VVRADGTLIAFPTTDLDTDEPQCNPEDLSPTIPCPHHGCRVCQDSVLLPTGSPEPDNLDRRFGPYTDTNAVLLFPGRRERFNRLPPSLTQVLVIHERVSVGRTGTVPDDPAYQATALGEADVSWLDVNPGGCL